MISIRKSVPDDLPRMLEIYERARGYMAENGNPHQWGDDGYPPRELLEQDIKEGVSFVCEQDGRIEGTFVFFLGEDPDYLRIDGGGWLNDAPYGVIHRVAGSGKVSGMLGYVLEYCRRRTYNLRMDTHHDNRIMRHLLEKHGFRRCGIIYVRDGSPRIAYHYVEE